MDSNEMTRALVSAFPAPGPVPALLVSEAEFVALVLAARDVVNNEEDNMVSTRDLAALDRASEPFSDLLGPLLEYGSDRNEQTRNAADLVLAWLDADCMTIPPVHHLRVLVEALR